MFLPYLIGMLYLVGVIRGGCPTTENAIKMADIKDAAEVSKFIYDDSVCKENAMVPNTEFKIIKTIHENLQSDGEGIRSVIADGPHNTRILAFRGTDGTEQLMLQIVDALKSKIKFMVGSHETWVLQFFHNAFKLMFYGKKPYMTDPKKRYIITGHSLGGALASMLALQMTQEFSGSIWKHPKSCLITFGQPRVGNQDYADVHDKLIPTFRKLRIVYKADLVTIIPPKILGFVHHSRAVFMGDETYWSWTWGKRRRRSLKHDVRHSNTTTDVGEKRLLTTRRYWQVCKEQEDSTCLTSLKNFFPNTGDHDMKHYVYESEHKPDRFYSRKETVRGTFEEVLIDTCHGR